MEKFVIGGSVVLGAAVVATAWWLSATGTVPELAAAAPPLPAAHAPQVTHAPTPATPAAAEDTLAGQVDALVVTRDPQKTYAAFRLLRDCATYNRDGDRLIFDTEESVHRNDGSLPGFRGLTADEKRHDAVFCARMTERMRQSRLDYLAFAAEAGVPGAVLEQIEQGPFGDRSALSTRPGDPLVREWKARVQSQLFRLAEQDANVDALSYLSAALQIGNEVIDRDPLLAYRYGVAYGMIMSDIQGPDSVTGKLYALDGSMTRETAAQLTPSERNAELLEARRIADLARLHRQQQQHQTRS
jgi:hypothetical protein